MNEHLKEPELDGVLRNIKIHTPSGPEMEEAMVIGAFAYRLVNFDDNQGVGWTVTHLATGKKLAWWWAEEGSVQGFLEAVRILRPHKPQLDIFAAVTKAAGRMVTVE